MDTKIIKKLDEIIKNMVTKDDLKQELKNFATKDDLKDGLNKLKRELIVHIEEGEIAIINGVDKYVIKRLDVLENRVEKVEHQLQQV